MMKYKGQEYPVSVFKVHIHDILLDRLDWIRDKLKLENNAEAFAAIVNSVYQQLHALDEYYNKGVIPEQSAGELKEHEDLTKVTTGFFENVPKEVDQ